MPSSGRITIQSPASSEQEISWTAENESVTRAVISALLEVALASTPETTGGVLSMSKIAESRDPASPRPWGLPAPSLTVTRMR